MSGKVATIGGCREYTGAPYFASITCLRVSILLLKPFHLAHSPELASLAVLCNSKSTALEPEPNQACISSHLLPKTILHSSNLRHHEQSCSILQHVKRLQQLPTCRHSLSALLSSSTTDTHFFCEDLSNLAALLAACSACSLFPNDAHSAHVMHPTKQHNRAVRHLKQRQHCPALLDIDTDHNWWTS